MVETWAERAHQRVARGVPEGPLAGVPVLLKDMIPWEGMRCTFGSVLARENVAGVNSQCVE